MNVAGGALSLYSLLIFARILLSWFGRAAHGRPYEILCQITDPYLFWFRRFPLFQAGSIDLSPIAALAGLSILNNIVSAVRSLGRISLGIITAIALQAVWSALSFILGFFIVIMALRLAAYIFNADIYSPFWRVIDGISTPVIYRVNRILFRSRTVNYLTGIISAIAAVLGVNIILGFAVRLLIGLLVRLPI
jgi:YggT family protein